MPQTTPYGGMGWRPSPPDFRDLRYAAPVPFADGLPAIVDRRSAMPPVYDQGAIGSCTANAIAAAFEYTLMARGGAAFTPSRLAIYHDERQIEGTVRQDSGAYVRDGLKVVYRIGAAPETLWPYDVSKFVRKPPAAYYREAGNHQAIMYRRVGQTLAEMKACLASGPPIVVGFTVYDSFLGKDVAQTGNVPMPAKTEKVAGGHAVLVVGYDDAHSVWIVRNSWGPGWGAAGYFYMPYAYLLDPNLSGDFWMIETIE